MCRPFQRDRQQLHAVLPILFIIYHYYTIGFVGFQGQNSNFFQKGVQNNAAEIVENGEIRLYAVLSQDFSALEILPPPTTVSPS